MARTAHSVSKGGSWSTIAALVAADGSASHPAFASRLEQSAQGRDLSDAVHALAMVHGRHPGVIDHAVGHDIHGAARDWLSEAADAFVVERAYLARLTAAAGPLPSTPGQPDTDAAIATLCHTLDMLAQSDRIGCATGAALALTLDWSGVRMLLDAAATKFGVETPPSELPIEADTLSLVATLGETAAVERAMGFGAQQLLAQHRGLWHLLAARSEAREAL